MLNALKDSVIISFFRGSEMKDPKGVLEKPGENSRFARYMRITDAKTAAALEGTILAYVSEAIKIEAEGRKTAPQNDIDLNYPQELIEYFEQHPDLEKAFAALTPGRKRGFLLHFSAAKQAKTKIARIKKSMPKILAGKGWNER